MTISHHERPQRRVASLVAVALTSVLAVGAARAEIPEGPAAAGEAEKKFGGLVDGRVGIGQVDEDLFLSVNIGTVLTWWKLGVGIQVPLRFRVMDEDPQNDGALRKEDWDEVSDWTRVVRFISWGTPDEWLYARIGVLEGTTIGHGTIVDRYMNVIDADHYQTGLQFKLDMDVAGGELFLDNLIDPEIFGMRAFMRPLQLWSGAPELAKAFEVGFTLVTDGVAPMQYETVQRPVTGGGFEVVKQVNEDGELVVTSEAAVLVGFDLGWLWRPVDWFAFRPYTDVNFLAATGGTGFHTGIAAAFDIAGAVTLGTRVEYRVVTADYAPSWVNSWYEIERVDYLPAPVGPNRDRVSKLKYYTLLDDAGEEDARHGWHASLDLTIMKAISFWALLEDYQGPDNSNLTMGVTLPYIAGVRAQIYYSKRNFNEASEAFDLDRGLFVADIRYKFWGPMFAFATYSREWRLDKDPLSGSFGEYETINDWDVGVGAEFEF